MSDLLIGLVLVAAGVIAFGIQQTIVNRATRRAERRDREVTYLIHAYRALGVLRSRMVPAADGAVEIDMEAMTRDELVGVERAVFDSVLFGNERVVEAVKTWEDKGDDWDTAEVMLVLRHEVRRQLGLAPFDSIAPGSSTDLDRYLPNMYGLITTAPDLGTDQSSDNPQS